MKQYFKNYILPSLTGSTYGCVFLLLLTSCNLFIEDDELPDEYGYSHLPEYSGKGYDTPETTTQGDCAVTYQLKKTVRQLERDNTKYITSVKQDDSGLFMEIHYSAETPSHLLPQSGQILVSTDTELFPMGCMHRVQAAEQRDGEYCYMATLAELQDTFDELDISGQLVSSESGTVYVEQEPDDSDEPTAATRSNRGIGIVGGVGLDMVDGGFCFTYTFPNEPVVKFSSPEFKRTDFDIYFNEGSVYKETHTFNFDDFSLSRSTFKITYELEKEYDVSLHVGSGFNGKKNIAKFRLIRGKPVVIGPVVLVLFANLNFDLEASIKVSENFSRHLVSRTTFNLDLMHPLDAKKTEKVVSDTGWKAQLMGAGELGIRATLELCIGLYGKILSLRLCPSIYFGFEATAASPIDRVDGLPVYDVSKKPGITPKFEFQMDAGIFFELSFIDFFKGIFEKLTSSNIGTALERLVDEAKDNSDWYKEHSAKSTWTDNDLERFRREDNSDNSSVTFTIGPYSLINSHTKTWYPCLEDNSFRVDSYYDELTHKLYCDASYTIEDRGLFSTFIDYIPALSVRYGSTQERLIYPDGEDTRARVQTGGHYTFTLPEYKNDRTYVAVPCYVRVDDPQRRPEVFDKGMPFSSTTPSVSISNVIHKGCVKTEGAFNVSVYNQEEDNYDNYIYSFQYVFNYDVELIVHGADHIKQWGLLEARFLHTFEYGEGANRDTSKGDGRYILHCTETIYSDNDIENRMLELWLKPRFTLNTGEIIYAEDAQIWRLYANGTIERTE